MLTEGDYSYIHYRHDVVEYAKKYGLSHYYHGTVDHCVNKECPMENVKYIVNIGTVANDIVSNGFIHYNPDVIVIHIQNSLLPNQYRRDYFENMQRFDITLEVLENKLQQSFISQLT